MHRNSEKRVTNEITGVTAALLVQDGLLALDDPVQRWLPELADRRVLRNLASQLDDTVPAQRAITVEDVLSFHLGFGSIMSPGPYPIQRAEAELGLKTLVPPWPAPDLTADEWLARLGSLPLLDQPGAAWRYNTGATGRPASQEASVGTGAQGRPGAPIRAPG